MIADTPPMELDANHWLMLMSIALGGRLDAREGELVLRTPMTPEGTSVCELPDAFDEMERRKFVVVCDPHPLLTRSGLYFLLRWMSVNIKYYPNYEHVRWCVSQTKYVVSE